jgi:uncharacterized integral membrane protein
MTHAQDGRHALPQPPEEVPPAVHESDVDDRRPTPATDVQPDASAPVKIKRTRVSGTWIAVIIALLVLVLLLIFILQNLATATVYFLGMSGSLPLAVAMLFAAIAGGLLVGLVGGARILQLRKETKKARRSLN